MWDVVFTRPVAKDAKKLKDRFGGCRYGSRYLPW